MPLSIIHLTDLLLILIQKGLHFKQVRQTSSQQPNLSYFNRSHSLINRSQFPNEYGHDNPPNFYILYITKMRRANAGIRIVMNQKETEKQVQARRLQSSQRKKPLLLKQLEHISLKLDHINQQNFVENQDPYQNDSILEDLQTLAKDAAKHDLKEIQKLCKLAIGKRILKIQLRRKKIEHQTKMEKREKVQLFFRQNRIKNFQYHELIEEKLKQSTLIAKPYPSGKGFVESITHYSQEYEKAFSQCNFLKVVNQANKLFYRNYSSLHKQALTLNETLLNLVWFPILVFICLAVTLPFVSFQYEQVILMVLLGVILSVLLFVSLRTFVDKPNNKNYIEQTVQDVNKYFQKLNQENLDRGINIQWNCDNDFMYLEVIFHDGFPQ